MWMDLYDTGFNGGVASPSVSAVLGWVLGPVGFTKFFAPITLLLVGLGAWTFFCALKFSRPAAILGALAAMLNSTFFATACWGVASQQIALGMNFFALALVVSNTNETPRHIQWIRMALAGLCVGINVMEAADIGALYSLIIAGFVFFKSWTNTEGGTLKKIVKGGMNVAVIAAFAGFMAYQTVITLVGTQIQGVAGTAQDTETKSQKWDWATQWSLPKKETLGILVPGLFGYKMDTPKDMMPSLQASYSGGAYWGGVGRDPALDRFLDSGGKGAAPSGFMRFTGGGNYCGILVLLIAAWAVAQSLRRQNSFFVDAQKRLIWFWAALFAISLPLAWGRFAPLSETGDSPLFYALLYKLPYFSTIRNPAKFLIFLSWAAAILFGYGIQALSVRYLDNKWPASGGLITQLKNWWAKASLFDRRWTWGCLALFGMSIIGWLIYSGEQPALIQYLQKMGFPDEDTAKSIASFSLGQVVWFLALFAVAISLVLLTVAGYFSGKRAKLGVWLLGIFLVFDLGRANLPYIIHWDYKQKYEVGSLNPIVDFLRQKPYKNRVVGLPFSSPQGLELLNDIYRIEWTQHLFPYYNIQCLDVIQMPRVPVDLKAYLEALSPRSPDTVPLIARRWQLTNTRYLLGAAGFLDVMNLQLDPALKRFHILQRFDIAPKPGVTRPMRFEELTAFSNDKGNYAIFEFAGALPRAKLYGSWQVNTNDEANLKTLADLNFDPIQTVLVSTPATGLPVAGTNSNSGTVTFKSYSPKHIVFSADTPTPSVMLLNDKYDPNWRVTVDGQPAQLLRCNFLMRGVQVPAGQHTVEFQFSMPNKPLLVTVAAMALAILLCIALFLQTRKKEDVQP